MKRTLTICLILLLCSLEFIAQPYVKIGGKLKITDVSTDTTRDSVLVRQADGTVASRPIESLLDRPASTCNSGYYVLPQNFDFENIPATHANSIWEIRHCHDLQNANVDLPPNVVLSFKGGQFTNFQSLTGDLTAIDAPGTPILLGTTIDGTWSLGQVNAAWLGVVPLPGIDVQPALTKAWQFTFDSGVRRLVIQGGSYHLDTPWRISGSNGQLLPFQIDGFGAILDNTVIVASQGASLRGLTVKGAPRHGFVFLRGQGAVHEHLNARDCGLDGYYFGIDSGEGNYGANFQVTRCVFSGLMAINNGRHGWLMEGFSTANRSWFNANSVISFGSIQNTGKGFYWIGGSGPNGGSQNNYNTYVNMNCEGNDDISIDLPEGRANTFIGGHFVDADSLGYTFRAPGPYNFSFGGRNVGKMEHSSFAYVNTADSGEGGIIARINSVDKFATKEITVTQEPFIPKGWSIFPKSLQSTVVAADNYNNHQVTLDLSAIGTAEDLMLRITQFGKRNNSGGNSNKYAYSILIQLGTDTAGNISVDWNRIMDDQKCVVNTVTETGGLITIDFTTTIQVFNGGVGVVEYQSQKEMDFR